MICLLQMPGAALSGQGLTGYTFKLVNMVPNSNSGETEFDSETNIAVDPADPMRIVGSAFTPNATGALNRAPVYVSADGGNTWSLQNIVPSADGMTGDISIDYAGLSHTLYAGILRGGDFFHCMVLRSENPGSGVLMTTLLDRNAEQVDQPFVAATTVNDGMGSPQDRVFVGGNNYGQGLPFGGTGRTAEMMFSNAGTSAPPSGFATRVMEVRNTNWEDYPPIRTAVHNSGVVYSIFFQWISGGIPNGRGDVIVVRDDNFGTGATQFAALTDGSDNLAGRKVATNRLVPAFGGTALGGNRLVGSNMAIAVDPNDARNVFVAWCDRVGATDYTLHLRRSENSGDEWSEDLLTITNATNPSIAITAGGQVGFIYQQLTDNGANARWETHFRLAASITDTYTDDVLSSFLDSDLNAATISPALGDYLELQAVGNIFYAVIPASNRMDAANWPKGVPDYARNFNGATGVLRNNANTADVPFSVDPFFVRIAPQLVFDICQIRPEVCFGWLVDRICRFPPFPCLRCPGPPCLSCPFEINFEDIIREVIKEEKFQTKLATPYYHLMLDGYDPKSYTLSIVNEKHAAIPYQLNRTEKGYALSFRAPKANYDREKGLHGLKLSALPFDASAAKRGAEFSMRLAVSDYKFKEFNAQQRNM